ncbi:MAG: glycine betaine ABC transporter substrate-binding protein [Ilumatobacter sp.]|jgi:osmoprotectant transport system substrate-binding protein|uniref:glycine betaine ABC transporter substrate-binding protein n=1 Tax=Ilumatobacter sp. TaxID=1967498 RepID=UPI003919E493
MKSTRQTTRLFAAAAAISLVAAACGSDDDGDAVDTTDAPAETSATDEPAETSAPAPSAECETAVDEDDSVASLTELDFSGIDVNVGSKDFVEQFVLSQLAIVALEAGGANVTDSTNLGGTVVNRDALLAGEIDTYFEYNGTGWTVHLAQEDPSFDPDVLTTDVCVNDLGENDVRWVGVSPFNNTYGFATAGDSPAAGLDLQGMMEYVNENPDATVCMETEYPNRPDGLVLLEEATGLTIPAGQEQILDVGVIYDETATGNCTFGEIFTTDGRIPALGLVVVEDPGVHVLYNVSMTMPDSVYQQAPEAFEALADTLLSDLDNDTIAELQRRVSADGEDPRAVAEDYLTQQGLI